MARRAATAAVLKVAYQLSRDNPSSKASGNTPAAKAVSQGITGGGTFKTKLTSATTLEATWEGAYELAGARAKAV